MKEITVDDLRRRLVAGEQIAVVDIRERDEYDDWHICGAVNVPVYNALNEGKRSAARDRLAGLPSDKPIVAVCRAGNTSQLAARMLESSGREAFSLAGGMHGWSNAWTEAPIPVPSSKDLTLIQIRRNGKGCLSYLVARGGSAAVVDPCLDASVYTDVAQRHGVKITHVLETHVHADHISRARALCEATKAKLCIPKNDRVQFEYTALEDGQTLDIGGTTCKVIMTPGHTLESACFDIDGSVLLSGDTIFVENIGRPDLEKGDEGAETGARLLYESLHERVLPLNDSVTICPGHTSEPIGFDGVAIAAGLGEIKPGIDLLRAEEEEFVRTIIGNLGQKPPNFQRVLSINEGRADIGWLDPLELEAGPNRCAVGRS